MSWAAHDLEPYAIQTHMGLKVAFVPLLIGSYAPDLTTKWFVYGITIFGVKLKADDPTQFHRGWPGAGFTHSLLFGVVIGLILWALVNRLWGIRVEPEAETHGLDLAEHGRHGYPELALVTDRAAA